MSQCLCCDNRDAGYKYACEHCVNDMRRWLRELEDYVSILLAMRGAIGSKPTGSVGVSFGSKPPMSLTPVAMLDPRSANPDRDDEPIPLSIETVTAVLMRDEGHCTWVSGLPLGGAWAYLADEYDPARRCEATARDVDHIANSDERDPDNLRTLCPTHLAYMRRRRPSVDGPDPVGAEEHDHIRSLPSAVHGIACWIREEREQSEPAHWTLVSELRHLRSEISACAIEQWVNELHADLKELHRNARGLAKDTPRPLAPCMSVGCDGMVFWDIHEENGRRVDQARCANPTCRRVYTGPDLVRLGVSEEMAG